MALDWFPKRFFDPLGNHFKTKKTQKMKQELITVQEQLVKKFKVQTFVICIFFIIVTASIFAVLHYDIKFTEEGRNVFGHPITKCLSGSMIIMGLIVGLIATIVFCSNYKSWLSIDKIQTNLTAMNDSLQDLRKKIVKVASEIKILKEQGISPINEENDLQWYKDLYSERECDIEKQKALLNEINEARINTLTKYLFGQRIGNALIKCNALMDLEEI